MLGWESLGNVEVGGTSSLGEADAQGCARAATTNNNTHEQQEIGDDHDKGSCLRLTGMSQGGGNFACAAEGWQKTVNAGRQSNNNTDTLVDNTVTATSLPMTMGSGER
jgi:hypothetical protein